MWKTVILEVLFLVLVGLVINQIFIKWRVYDVRYDHFPGRCTQFNMSGSEDIIILPNGHAIITSGLHMNPNHVYPDDIGALYVLDMSDPYKGPKKLKFTGTYHLDTLDFNPHGVSYWINERNEILLYVICHHDTATGHDSIDVFRYSPDTVSVEFIRRISDPSVYNLNNLVVLSENELYVTNWKYFNRPILHMFEQLFTMPFSRLHYVKDGKFQTVASGLKSANGINMSRNKKFIYVIHSLGMELLAYTRSADGSITLVDSIWTGFAMDNLNVDEDTGDLWLPMFSKPLKTLKHFEDHSPSPTEVLHIVVDEDSEKPFTNAKIESVYESDGSNGLGAISAAAYSNGTLLLGTVLTNMAVCDIGYLQY